MKFHKPTLLLAEIRESFSMAMNALTAHKLRSALTLLGVLIGVFSIIVVMTAMRVLKRSAEDWMSGLAARPLPFSAGRKSGSATTPTGKNTGGANLSRWLRHNR